MDRDEKGNWVTPFVGENAQRTEIVTPGSRRLRSYDLEGKLLWELKGVSSIAIPGNAELLRREDRRASNASKHHPGQNSSQHRGLDAKLYSSRGRKTSPATAPAPMVGEHWPGCPNPGRKEYGRLMAAPIAMAAPLEIVVLTFSTEALICCIDSKGSGDPGLHRIPTGDA